MAIFIAQFVTVYLLGVQSLNVRDGNYIGAALTSTALGCSGYYLAATVGKLPADAWLTAPWWAYIAAGPVAICSAIKTHPLFKRALRKHGGNRHGGR